MVRTVGPAAAALTTAMVPIFLLGALSENIRQELGLGEAAIGAIITVVFLVAAAAATPAGRLSERVGAGPTLRTGVVLAGLVAVAVAAFARTWLTLVLPLSLVGVSMGLVDTGAARAFADRLTAGQHGQAFGLKEASVPAASLFAGVAVPVIAAPLGWRPAFLGGAVVAAVVLVLLRGVDRRPVGTSRTDAPVPDTGAADAPVGDAQAVDARVAEAVADATADPPATGASRPRVSSATLGFAVGVGLGAGAATAAATFLVPGLLAQGLTPTVAGLVLAVASVASIVVRIGAGRWADLPGTDPMRAVLVLCVTGCLAAVVLGLSVVPAVSVLAAVLVLGGGWGWTGLAFLAAVRANPAAPATAAGVVLSGLGLGGALGPLAFGTLAGRVSYLAAWAMVAGGLAAAAAGVLLVRRTLSHAGTQAGT